MKASRGAARSAGVATTQSTGKANHLARWVVETMRTLPGDREKFAEKLQDLVRRVG
jgi:hypothetical protein